MIEPTAPQFTRAEARTRWGRFIQFPLVRIVVALLFIAPAIALNNLMMIFAIEKLPTPHYEAGRALMLLVTVFLIFRLYGLYTRKVEAREPTELSARGAFGEFGKGAGLAVAIIGLCWAIMFLAGAYEFVALGSAWMLPYALAVFGGGAFLQVMLFRVIFFRLTEELLGTWIAYVLISVLFGAAHLLNGNMDALSLFTMIFGDVLLASTFVLTRRLWLVWGLHAGWNFTQDGILGMPNSGITRLPSWIEADTGGPAWLSGGDYGLDGSLLALGLTVTLGACFFVLAWRRERIVAPRWRR